MKLLIATPRLEIGRCGVGDHALRIGHELTRQGHGVTAMAFDDEYVDKATHRLDDGLDVVRFPKNCPHDWASLFGQSGFDGYLLQMTPWQLGSRGIRRSHTTKALVAELSSLCGAVYLHEIWTGAFAQAPPRDAILGHLQRRNLKRVLESLKPRSLLTSNSAYRSLAEVAFRRNVSVVELPGAVDVSREANARGWVETPTIRAVFFGSVAPEWPAKRCLQALTELGKTAGKAVTLTVVNPSDASWSRFRSNVHVQVHRTGCLEPPALSRLLSEQHIGLVGVPAILAGKSSSLSTLREHGLPVWLLRDDVRLGKRGRLQNPTTGGTLITPDATPQELMDLMSGAAAIEKSMSLSSIATALASACVG